MGLLGVPSVSSCVESRDKLITDHFCRKLGGRAVGSEGKSPQQGEEKINKAIPTNLREMLGLILTESQMFGIFNICFLRGVFKTS